MFIPSNGQNGRRVVHLLERGKERNLNERDCQHAAARLVVPFGGPAESSDKRLHANHSPSIRVDIVKLGKSLISWLCSTYPKQNRSKSSIFSLESIKFIRDGPLASCWAIASALTREVGWYTTLECSNDRHGVRMGLSQEFGVTDSEQNFYVPHNNILGAIRSGVGKAVKRTNSMVGEMPQLI